MTCPKCGFEQADGLAECGRCGVLFAKVASARQRAVPAGSVAPLAAALEGTGQPRFEDVGSTLAARMPAQAGQSESERALGLDASARRALAAGAFLALLFVLVPLLRFVMGYLVTLVHEFGHFVTNWVFGYPSVPAFDLMYGGGITIHQDRSVLVTGAVYALFAMAAFRLRTRRKALAVLAAVAALYALAAFTRLHELLELGMGHGSELIFTALFLYRALSGEKMIVQGERTAYAFAGFFIFFYDVRFAAGLMASHELRVEYELAKGGGAWMDFSQIAADWLHTNLASVAAIFLLATLAVPVATLYAYRKRVAIASGLTRLIAA